MFSDELEKYSWEDITACIASKRNRDVEIALGKEHLQLDDFMALVSPAAAPYIEHMAALSRLYTQERFGKTIQMYVPLYITNHVQTTVSTVDSITITPLPELFLPRKKSKMNAGQSVKWDRSRICLS